MINAFEALPDNMGPQDLQPLIGNLAYGAGRGLGYNPVALTQNKNATVFNRDPQARRQALAQLKNGRAYKRLEQKGLVGKSAEAMQNNSSLTRRADALLDDRVPNARRIMSRSRGNYASLRVATQAPQPKATLKPTYEDKKELIALRRAEKEIMDQPDQKVMALGQNLIEAIAPAPRRNNSNAQMRIHGPARPSQSYRAAMNRWAHMMVMPAPA